MKKTVTTTELVIDLTKNTSVIDNTRFPECTEILSVQKNEETNKVSIVFAAPSNMFDSHLWRNYTFVACKCSYDTEYDFDDHKYLDSIQIGNDIYAIFYKPGLFT